jgi:hypothetical protein
MLGGTSTSPLGKTSFVGNQKWSVAFKAYAWSAGSRPDINMFGTGHLVICVARRPDFFFPGGSLIALLIAIAMT